MYPSKILNDRSNFVPHFKTSGAPDIAVELSCFPLLTFFFHRHDNFLLDGTWADCAYKIICIQVEVQDKKSASVCYNINSCWVVRKTMMHIVYKAEWRHTFRTSSLSFRFPTSCSCVEFLSLWDFRSGTSTSWVYGRISPGSSKLSSLPGDITLINIGRLWYTTDFVFSWNSFNRANADTGRDNNMLRFIWHDSLNLGVQIKICCLQGQLCDVRLWFWPHGKMIGICRNMQIITILMNPHKSCIFWKCNSSSSQQCKICENSWGLSSDSYCNAQLHGMPKINKPLWHYNFEVIIETLLGIMSYR